MKTNVEQRGTPPYIVISAETTEIPGHHMIRDTFIGALRQFFDLAEAGYYTKGPYETLGARVVDSHGNVIFSTDRPADLELLKQIDEG